MAFSAADIQMVNDHINQGMRHVARQEELVAWLRERGHPTDMAEQLLAEFEATLLQHREHRELMMHDRHLDAELASGRGKARPKESRSPKKD